MFRYFLSLQRFNVSKYFQYPVELTGNDITSLGKTCSKVPVAFRLQIADQKHHLQSAERMKGLWVKFETTELKTSAWTKKAACRQHKRLAQQSVFSSAENLEGKIKSNTFNPSGNKAEGFAVTYTVGKEIMNIA